MIQKALIIAAGNGSRLSSGKLGDPKPLRKVGGLPLIKRIILSAKKGGITEFVIVVGYQKEKIISALSGQNLGVTLTFVENPDWKKSNGLSVLAARELLRENFILLMTDHIFDFQTLQKLRYVSLGTNKTILAVDAKLSTIFDMDDATKVEVKEGQILKIGKALTEYNAVDTGMFLASPSLFDALEEAKKEGNCSLSDGIQLLATRGEMGTFDIGEARWFDVDTPSTIKDAEKYLFNVCRKSTDGLISRHFNRPISLFISRFLIKTPLSANQVTGITTLVGILSGLLTAMGNYTSVAIGAFLFQLASIMDGCDGEVSKLKMTDSKFGQWLDTISDNFTYLFYIVGVIFGVAKQGYEPVILVGTVTLFGLSMTLFVMFYYLIRYTNSGSLIALQNDFQNQSSNEKGGVKRFFASIQFMVKRDFFALVFFTLAVFGGLRAVLWLSLIGSNVTWIVLLSSRLGLLGGSPFSKSNTVLTEESPDLASR